MAARSLMRRLQTWFNRGSKFVLIGLIRVYQLVVSPWLTGRCRHVPSCSQYGLEAIERYGALRGGWLALKRVGRCRPGGSWGYDPVPEPEDEHAKRLTNGL